MEICVHGKRNWPTGKEGPTKQGGVLQRFPIARATKRLPCASLPPAVSGKLDTEVRFTGFVARADRVGARGGNEDGYPSGLPSRHVIRAAPKGTNLKES